MTTEFTVGDTTFTVGRLKVKASLTGLRLVGKVLLPALAEASGATGSGQLGGAVQRVVEGLDTLPELLDLFAEVTKIPSPTSGAPVSLKPFIEDVFGGRPDHVVEFLVHAVQGEFGGFLDANGPLGGLLAKAKAATAAPSVSATS